MYPRSTWPTWLLIAWSQKGLQEQPGKGNSGDIQLMFKDVNSPEISADEVPWCAAFVGSCLIRAGQKSSSSLMAKSYLNYGYALGGPIPGALAVFNRGNDPNAGHVGFVVDWDEQHVFILGGNQSNSVSVKKFKSSEALTFRRPIIFATAPGRTRFQASMDFVEEMEGGWSDHPSDTPTMYGITLDTFHGWRNSSVTKEDLRAISREEADLIYQTFYWFKGHCDRLPVGLDLMHFDACVNQGVGRANRFLQATAETTQDGEIGPKTLNGLVDVPTELLIRRYEAIRNDHYHSLSKFKTFGRGWMNRLSAVTKEAFMGITSNPSIPTTENTMTSSDDITNVGKPTDTEATNSTTDPAPEAKWWLKSKTIWGSVMVAASTVLPLLLSFYGIDVSGDEIQIFGDKAFEVLQIVGGLVGTFLAIYGRVDAAQSLTSKSFKVSV